MIWAGMNSLTSRRLTCSQVVGKRSYFNLLSTTEKPRVKEIVLVRHGQSEGNIARARSLKGDHSLYSGKFLERHSSLWRLTDLGKEQAQAAGECVREKFPGENYFDRYYVSEYLRAMETAGLMNLPNAKWLVEVFLRERCWGEMDLMSQEQRLARFRHFLSRKDRESIFWTPPNGESMVDVCLRIDRLLTVLHSECQDQAVISVCHGEVMWAFRLRLERLTQMRYNEIRRANRPEDHIHNGLVLHYSRVDPSSGKVANKLNWFRSYCPWNPQPGDGEWRQISRPVFSNEDLMSEVDRVPRLISSDASDLGDAS